uniref:transglycosylase domain-containing protein n=1 Tax=Clavibacter michiganensis TaxID=28447 RepID=UPI00292D126F
PTGTLQASPHTRQTDNRRRKAVPSATPGDSQVHFAEFFSRDREKVPWEPASSYAKDPAFATEDPRYYAHGGVDVLSAARALAQYVLNYEFPSGACTITMQYVRNVLFQTSQHLVSSSDADSQAAGHTASN